MTLLPDLLEVSDSPDSVGCEFVDMHLCFHPALHNDKAENRTTMAAHSERFSLERNHSVKSSCVLYPISAQQGALPQGVSPLQK